MLQMEPMIWCSVCMTYQVVVRHFGPETTPQQMETLEAGVLKESITIIMSKLLCI